MVQRISADAYIAAYVPVPGYIPFLAEENYGPRIERSEVWLLTCDDGDVGVAMLEERRDHLLLYSVAELDVAGCYRIHGLPLSCRAAP